MAGSQLDINLIRGLQALLTPQRVTVSKKTSITGVSIYTLVYKLLMEVALFEDI